MDHQKQPIQAQGRQDKRWETSGIVGPGSGARGILVLTGVDNRELKQFGGHPGRQFAASLPFGDDRRLVRDCLPPRRLRGDASGGRGLRRLPGQEADPDRIFIRGAKSLNEDLTGAVACGPGRAALLVFAFERCLEQCLLAGEVVVEQLLR